MLLMHVPTMAGSSFSLMTGRLGPVMHLVRRISEQATDRGPPTMPDRLSDPSLERLSDPSPSSSAS